MEQALEIPRTCLNYFRYDLTNARYLPRCSCPDNMVENNGTCILPKDCPCVYNNQQFNAGTSVNIDCNEW